MPRRHRGLGVVPPPGRVYLGQRRPKRWIVMSLPLRTPRRWEALALLSLLVLACQAPAAAPKAAAPTAGSAPPAAATTAPAGAAAAAPAPTCGPVAAAP